MTLEISSERDGLCLWLLLFGEATDASPVKLTALGNSCQNEKHTLWWGGSWVP